MSEELITRIKLELKKVGVNEVNIIAPQSKSLAQIIHNDEHIGGAVYGKYSGGLAWLIATDKRVIFIDKKPFFSSVDEISYEVVTGTKINKAGLATAIVLHTRINEYSISFVKSECARIFVKYIEKMSIEKKTTSVSNANSDKESANKNFEIGINEENNNGLEFIRTKNTAVISSIDRNGSVHGAVIYYLIDQKNEIYILTKSDTQKAINMYQNNNVAITVFDENELKTAQIQGFSEIVTNEEIKALIYTKIVKPRKYADTIQLPPVAFIKEGAYVVIKIVISKLKFRDFKIKN